MRSRNPYAKWPRFDSAATAHDLRWAQGEAMLMDFAYLGLSLALFALTLGLIQVCARV